MPPRYKDLNLTLLRTFCEFVRQRSFTDAARKLKVSHSAVWQQVRALERRFDVTLLERHGRAWRPTSDGDALLDAISEILQSVDGLEDRFRRIRDDVPRTLAIIASPGTVLGEIDRPLREFRRAQPNCFVRITVSVSMEQATEQLLAGTADVTIASQSIVGQVPLRRSLQRTVFATRPSAIAVAKGHPLATKRSITLKDLARNPLLSPLPSHLWRQRVDDAFRAAGLLDQVQYAVEASLTIALRRWAAGGLGVAIFPHIEDGFELPEVVIRSVEHLFPSEEVVCLHRKGAMRPEVQLFEQLLIGSKPSVPSVRCKNMRAPKPQCEAKSGSGVPTDNTVLARRPGVTRFATRSSRE